MTLIPLKLKLPDRHPFVKKSSWKWKILRENYLFLLIKLIIYILHNQSNVLRIKINMLWKRLILEEEQ